MRDVIDSTEWRREYMLLEWRDQDNVEKGRRLGLEEGLARGLEKGRTEGHQEGLAEGLTKGITEGAESLGRLVSALLGVGRIDDAAKAASDPQERARLAAELGIELPAR